MKITTLTLDLLNFKELKDLCKNKIHPSIEIDDEIKTKLSTLLFLENYKLINVEQTCSTELKQRLMDLEAVHPMKSLSEVDSRLATYRRCFILLHKLFPEEPIVILHCALMSEPPLKLEEIIQHQHVEEEAEQLTVVHNVIFYSISSPHRGLGGLELGANMIKRALTWLMTQELPSEVVSKCRFITLSPLPLFRCWLDQQLHNSDDDSSSDVWSQLDIAADDITLLNLDLPTNHENCRETTNHLLARLAAYYLCRVKRPHTQAVYDPVCNFHLKNGASVWRIRLCANPSPAGMAASYGVMASYRYRPDRLKQHSASYTSQQFVTASQQILDLLPSTHTH